MIERTTGYKVGERVFATLLMAQVVALQTALPTSEDVATKIVEAKDKVLHILMQDEQPKAPRKTRQKRTPKTPVEAKA